MESATASTSVPSEEKNSVTNSDDALSEIAISNVCSLANEKSEPRRSQRCSARRITELNEDPIQIESDDDDSAKITKPEQPSNPVKMVLAELVKSSGDKTAIELDKPVAATTDNPIVIDITDDAEDMDFSCSQILQMSQIVSDRVPDDVYQKIKNELAEMDYCNDGVVVNADLIDSDDENSGGFQNTQEIFEVLEDTVEPSADKEVLGAIDDLARLFEDEPVATPPRQSPRSKPASSKITAEKKSITQKDFLTELKRRKNSNSPHVEINNSLKEERRKKLKELTGSTSSSTVQPTQNEKEVSYPTGKKRISGQPTVTTILGIDLNPKKPPEVTLGRRKSLYIEKRKKSASPARSKSLTRASVSNQDNSQTRKTLNRECKRLKVQTPPPNLVTNKIGNAVESSTKKRGRPRKSVEAVAIEPLQWQKYDVPVSQ